MIIEKKDLEKSILFEPALIDGLGCSTLKIITGYTDIGRISSHMISLMDGIRAGKYVKGIKVEIILGMAKTNGLSEYKHKKIVETLNELNATPGMPKIKCFYVVKGSPVHSKVYVWLNGPNPICAFCGSANYSMNAFGDKSRQRECMTTCNPDCALDYFMELKNECIDCNDSKAVMSNISFSAYEHKKSDECEDRFNIETLYFDYFAEKEPIDTLNVSLLKSKRGGFDVGYGSGINWGIRPNGEKRNKNQAYIPYNREDRRKGFFPDERVDGEKNYPIFKVVTKEKGAFFMRIAQGRGKALHTPQSNAILGEWIRNILRMESGAFIKKDDLERYGKTYVTFKKYHEEGEDIYTLEF